MPRYNKGTVVLGVNAMTITIDLPAETEARLREQAARSGANLEEFLCALAQHWAQGNGAASSAHTDPRTSQQKAADFLAWTASHDQIIAVADDSRESIYEGCGEPNTNP
jgi:hypothetical protein